MKRYLTVLVSLALLLVVACSGEQHAEKTATEEAVPELQSKEVPQVVMDGLKARFPDADIQEWTREKEGELVVYDFEFIQDSLKLEADVMEDGSIFNWEKAIAIGDLPEVVRQAAETKYPDSTIQEIMEVTAVTDGQEALEAYEILLRTADDENVEIAVDPDGRIVEDSGETMPEAE